MAKIDVYTTDLHELSAKLKKAEQSLSEVQSLVASAQIAPCRCTLIEERKRPTELVSFERPLITVEKILCAFSPLLLSASSNSCAAVILKDAIGGIGEFCSFNR